MTTKLLRSGVAGFFLASATLLPAAIPPAENLLPADTIAFFTVPSMKTFRAESKTSPQMTFWDCPAMKPFHDKFMAGLDKRFLAPLEKDLGIKASDFFNLPQGQLTLAVTVNGSNGHDDVPPGIIFLLDAGNKSDQLKTNLTQLTHKWTAEGRSLRKKNIRGLDFTVVPLTTNDFAGIFPPPVPVSVIGHKTKVPQPGKLYFTQYKSLLVAGNSARAMEAVAAHLTGGGAPAIADEANFNSDKLSQFRNAPTYYGWFNGSKFFGLLTAKSDSDDGADGDMASRIIRLSSTKVLNAIGLSDLKSASFTLREEPDGSHLTMHISAPESSRTGLLKILAAPSKNASIPAFVPANVTKFTRIRLDGRQTWAELQKMVAKISPQYLASLNAVVDMANTLARQKDPGFDLRTALFNNLGDDMIVYQEPPVGDSLADFAQPPTLYLIAVDNTDQAINGIKTLASLTAPQTDAPKPRIFLGHKIYSIAQRRRPLPNGKKTPPTYLYLTANSGYVAMSKNISILEEYLRSAQGTSRSLRDQPGIARATSEVGGTRGGLFSYENQKETTRIAFKVLKSSAGRFNPLRMLPAAFRGWADFSLLPNFDKVSKYFYLSVVSGRADAEGMTLQVFTPRPPQLH